MHFLENLKVDKVPKEQREKELLLDKNWPFPGEGPEVKQEDAPKASEASKSSDIEDVYRIHDGIAPDLVQDSTFEMRYARRLWSEIFHR